MPTNAKLKRIVRALQDRTGWTYSECLRCVREMTPEAIERLILERVAVTKAAGGV